MKILLHSAFKLKNWVTPIFSTDIYSGFLIVMKISMSLKTSNFRCKSCCPILDLKSLLSIYLECEMKFEDRQFASFFYKIPGLCEIILF